MFSMQPKSCPDCSLREFLTYWLCTSGLFYFSVAAIVMWANKTLSSHPRHKETSVPNTMTKWLEQYGLISRRNALAYFALYVVLLLTELFDGYQILTICWSSMAAYWNWDLKKREWALQFWQFVAVSSLTIMLAILLAVGFGLIVITLACLVELWQWKPSGCPEKLQHAEGDDRVDRVASGEVRVQD